MRAAEFSLFLNCLHFVAASKWHFQLSSWLWYRSMCLMWWPRFWLLLLFHEKSPEGSSVCHTLSLTIIQTIITAFIYRNLYWFKWAVFTSNRTVGLKGHNLRFYATFAWSLLFAFGFGLISIKFEISFRLLLVWAIFLELFYVCIYLCFFVRVYIEGILLHRRFSAWWLRVSTFEAIFEKIEAAVSIYFVTLCVHIVHWALCVGWFKAIDLELLFDHWDLNMKLTTLLVSAVLL